MSDTETTSWWHYLLTDHVDRSNIDAVVAAFSKALSDSDSHVHVWACNRLYLWGSGLRGDMEGRLIQLLDKHPTDLATRILLVGYYSRTTVPSTTDYTANCERIMLWVIANHPQCDFCDTLLVDIPKGEGPNYEQAKELWLGHLNSHKNDLRVIRNAAAFFALDEPALSIPLLEKAQRLDPDNPEWYQRSAHVRRLQLSALSGDIRILNARKALRDLQKAASLRGETQRTADWLVDLARAAYDAEEYVAAEHYATEALDQAQAYKAPYDDPGPALHHGHLILGRLAMLRGDVQCATQCLLDAAAVPSDSPALLSGGPKMMLAKELLDRGMREPVLEYLRLCASFWQTPDHELQKWAYIIEQGGVPDFGINL